MFSKGLFKSFFKLLTLLARKDINKIELGILLQARRQHFTVPLLV